MPNKESENKDPRRLHEIEGCKADLYCTDERMNGRPMKGRVTYVADGNKMSFVQYLANPANRSRQLYRTDHGILNHRADGTWYLSFRFTGEERLLKENLMVELRDIVKMVELKMKHPRNPMTFAKGGRR